MEAKRGFHHYRSAWYALPGPLPSGAQDQVSFGLYHPDGSTEGEMLMEWHRLGHALGPRLVAWGDAWRVLAGMPDVLELLGELNDRRVVPAAFSNRLRTLGFADLTKTQAD